MAGLWFIMFRVDRIEFKGTMQGEQLQLEMREFKTELAMQILNRVVLDEEQLLFIAGGQDSTFDDDLDEPPVQDFALNMDHVFQADQCDAFDSDVDEALTAQTMFMANLSSANLIYDEAGPSYDSDILSEAAKCISANEQNKVVNESLTAELARYKEQVEIYEKRARFKLTEREQKIDEQLRIIITDRNNKEESLKKKENKYLEDFLDMKALKEKVEDKLFKQDQSLQTVHMLCKPKPFYDEKKKVAIGYKNPLYLTSAMQVQSTLYNGHEIVKTNHAPAVVHDSEDTLELAGITRKKMLEKMQSPLCVENKVKIAPLDYLKENYLATFKPQRQLSAEQIFWSSVLKPILEMTVYPPNTPAKAYP
ncbi:hypothetical protein Tco_0981645 [Tanacetum coccineum]